MRAVSYKSHIICQVAFVILFLWDKRFLTETKNVFEGKDYIRTNEYDPVFGVINSATDVNGFTTQYKYDNFGRLKKEIAPDGYQASSVLRWVQNSDQHAPENALYYKWSKKSGMAEAITYFDYQGRLLRSVNIGLDNEKLYADKEYYALGNVKKSSLPYFAGNSPIWTTYNYDDLQRLEYVNSPISTIKTIYDGRKKTITNVNTGQSKSKEVNAIGQTIIETDDGGDINYNYYSSGNPKEIICKGETINMEYDSRGNQTLLNDPNTGEFTYKYNTFGQLVEQKHPKGYIDKLIYDDFGRLKEKYSEEENTFYYFNNEEGSLGLLDSVWSTSQNAKAYFYDEYNRIKSANEHIFNETFKSEFSYDVYGRNNKLIYPTGFIVDYHFDKKGYLKSISTPYINDENIWEAHVYNEFGQVEQFTKGNGKTSFNDYDQFGFPDRFTTEGIFDQDYTFDYEWSNLRKREDRSQEGILLTEEYGYDNLDRLTNITLNGVETMNLNYTPNENGNINYKSDAGTYFYGQNGTKPHAVTSIQSELGTTPTFEQTIDYTSFDKVKKITENSYDLDIDYGLGTARKRSKLSNNDETVLTKLFVDIGYEKEIYHDGLERELHYLDGAVYVKRNDGTDTLYYTYGDYQGTLQAITDEGGNVVERTNFDAWGRRRNPTDWTYDNVPKSHILDRGYTGHEHLDHFGLINMNGRVYDPVVGRFLSPDNFVHEGTQGLNRYSYALNNPLKYTDPSGENPIVIGLIIFSAVQASVKAAAYNENIVHAVGISLIVSGVSAGMGAGFGELASILGITGPAMGAVYGAATGAIIAGVSGGVASMLYGDTFGNGFKNSFTYGAVMGALNGAMQGYNAKQIAVTGAKVKQSTISSTTEDYLDIGYNGDRVGYNMPDPDPIAYTLNLSAVEIYAKAPDQAGGGDLGFIGNQIRDRAGSEFSKGLFENYWLGGGNMTLSATRFNSIVTAAGDVVSTTSVTLANGQPGVANVHDFYGSSEYGLALGQATIYYNQAGAAVGFHDGYDFNPLPWGTRSYSNEIKTRMVRAAGALYGASPYDIYYGVGIKP